MIDVDEIKVYTQRIASTFQRVVNTYLEQGWVLIETKIDPTEFVAVLGRKKEKDGEKC